MFNKDFYPTPKEVFDMMGVDCFNKTIYDPSAGSGNLIEFALSSGAKKAYASEIEPKLRDIVRNKAILINEDFLSVVSEQISHIDLIIMNPPFSKDVEHILHAFEVAPDGCEIYSLCNFESLDNDYSSSRKQLGRLIGTYGQSSFLGNVFKDAERTTNVNVGLIKLFKPKAKGQDFSDFFTDEQDDNFGGQEGILPHNQIREVVQRYVNSVILFDKFIELKEQMNNLNSHLNLDPFKVSIEYKDNILTRQDFMIALQKKSWRHVFNLMKVEKYLTKGVKDDLNKFIEQQQKYPFTMKNIFSMVEVILGTREQTLSKALCEAVDNYTKHTHENRYNVEGWKTNSGYMLNKKFIIERMVTANYSSGLSINDYGDIADRFNDLQKVLCFLTGKDFNKVPSIRYAPCTKVDGGYLTEKGHTCKTYNETPYHDKLLNYNLFTPNIWYTHEFFEFKVFKKGTMHLKFRDVKVWELLNRKYAEIKGFTLPDKF